MAGATKAERKAVAERRLRVQEMSLRGMRVGEIAAEEGVEHYIISRDLKHIAENATPISKQYVSELAIKALKLATTTGDHIKVADFLMKLHKLADDPTERPGANAVRNAILDALTGDTGEEDEEEIIDEEDEDED